jgi:hypothetical protein
MASHHISQEHRLVAELYRYLAPFIDTTKEIYISPDGQAVKTAHQAGVFADAGVPDLWFTLAGEDQPILIEAKVLGERGKALLMQTQINAWRTAGRSRYKPRFWVATNRAFDRFYSWTHAEFLPALDACKAPRNQDVSAPKSREEFTSIALLALHVLRRGPAP